jgi:plastocyanin
MTRHALTTLLLLASLAHFAACGRNETADTDTQGSLLPPVESATDSATHPGSPGGTAVVPDVAAGTTVLVVVTEGSIALKGQEIPPGPAVLTIENGGKETHNLFIEGEGISRAAEQTISAGGSTTLDVMFKPGTYTLYCPILDHRTKGEESTITITGAPAGTTTTTSTATAGTT